MFTYYSAARGCLTDCSLRVEVMHPEEKCLSLDLDRQDISPVKVGDLLFGEGELGDHAWEDLEDELQDAIEILRKKGAAFGYFGLFEGQ